MRQAGFYPAGERHHVVRIPAAAQAEAHPGYSHVPPCLFITIAVVHMIELHKNVYIFKKENFCQKLNGFLINFLFF